MAFLIVEENGRQRPVLCCDVLNCQAEIGDAAGGVVVVGALAETGYRGVDFACGGECAATLVQEAGEGAGTLGLSVWWQKTGIRLGVDEDSSLFADDDAEPPSATDLAALLDDLAPRVPAGLTLADAIRRGYIVDAHVAAAW